MTHNMSEHSHKNFPALKNSTDRHCRRRRRQMSVICKRVTCTPPHSHRAPTPSRAGKPAGPPWRRIIVPIGAVADAESKRLGSGPERGAALALCFQKQQQKRTKTNRPPSPSPLPLPPFPLHPEHCEATHAGHRAPRLESKTVRVSPAPLACSDLPHPTVT